MKFTPEEAETVKAAAGRRGATVEPFAHDATLDVANSAEAADVLDRVLEATTTTRMTRHCVSPWSRPATVCGKIHPPYVTAQFTSARQYGENSSTPCPGLCQGVD